MRFFLTISNQKVIFRLQLFAALLLLCLLPIQNVSAALVEVIQAGGAGADTHRYMSADGRYIGSSCAGDDDTPGDTNGFNDACVYDRTLDTFDLVSLASNGTQGNAASLGAVVSDDGRYAAFLSAATNLVAGDTNGVTDAFVYDRDTNTIERANVDDLGSEADAYANDIYISGDGQHVAFTSAATNLIFGEVANGQDHAYVYHVGTNTIERIDEDENGVEGDSYVLNVTLSEDGRYAAFDSSATNLLAGYGNGFQIYVKDMDTGEVEILSISDAGVEGNSVSRIPYITHDGRYVSFESLSSNLVSDDTNGDFDIFVYDRQSDIIEMASVSSSEVKGNSGSQFSSLSNDGNYITFFSSATNLISGDTNGLVDVFLRDRVAGLTSRLQVFTRYGFIAADGEFAFYDEGSSVGVFSINRVPTDISLSPSSVSENENSGTNIGNFTATDANTGDTHTFSLACTTPGADDSSFSISGDSLRSSESFDYETKSSYAICVRATDSESATYDENMTVTITDQSESSGGSGTGTNSNPPSPTPEPEPTPDPTPDPTPEPEPEPTPDPIPEPVPEPEPELVPENEIPDEPEVPDAPAVPENNPADTDSPNSPADGDGRGDKPTEFENFPEVVAYVLGDFVEEIPKGTIDTVSVAGVTLPAVAFIVTQPAVAVNLASLPMRLWNLLPIWLGFRRKKRPWGTVYDSVTKQPLDPVYVSLKALNGKEVATTITDLDGRFGFLVAPGRYKIVLRKDNYVFPSKKLAGKGADDLYGAVYEGEEIDIAGEESLVIKNIPMDSESFNWNEFEKAKNKKLMKFYSKRDVLIANVANVAFWGGLACSLVLLFTSPSKLNYILLGVYLIVLLLRMFGVKPKKPGYVTEKETGYPLSFGVVKIFSVAQNVEIGHAVIGKTGKYYTLVPNGNYYVTIDKKVGEDSYKPVYKSEPFHVKKGFIGQNFDI